MECSRRSSLYSMALHWHVPAGTDSAQLRVAAGSAFLHVLVWQLPAVSFASLRQAAGKTLGIQQSAPILTPCEAAHFPAGQARLFSLLLLVLCRGQETRNRSSLQDHYLRMCRTDVTLCPQKPDRSGIEAEQKLLFPRLLLMKLPREPAEQHLCQQPSGVY